jgi:arylsulfatase A-like enzyme
MEGPPAGPDRSTAPAGSRPRRTTLPNVVIVTVDCLRRDRVSAYGYARATTPFLDSLLDSSTHCTSAHSVSSWTCPAVVSLHTGLYPHHHGGGIVAGEPKNLSKSNLPTILPSDVPTLTGSFAGAGYATAAMIAVWNANLPMPGLYAHQETIEKPAPALVRRGLRWIREQEGPSLLWLHLGDCHEPLDVDRSLRDVFGPPPRGRAYRRWAYTKATDRVDTGEFERYRKARIRLYDASVRSVDAALAGLWAGLREQRLDDRTIVIVSADHGEEMWEHRADEIANFTDPRGVAGTGHGHNLFQVHLLIPLLVTGPGVPVGEVSGNVSLVDVAPTLADAIDLPLPRGDGTSIFEPGPRPPVLAEGIAYGYEKVAVVDGDVKLLHAPADGYERLWTLGVDRRERDVIDDPAVAARLRAHVPAGASTMGERVRSTPEIEAHLRGLGYIE